MLFLCNVFGPVPYGFLSIKNSKTNFCYSYKIWTTFLIFVFFSSTVYSLYITVLFLFKILREDFVTIIHWFIWTIFHIFFVFITTFYFLYTSLFSIWNSQRRFCYYYTLILMNYFPHLFCLYHNILFSVY